MPSSVASVQPSASGLNFHCLNGIIVAQRLRERHQRRDVDVGSVSYQTGWKSLCDG